MRFFIASALEIAGVAAFSYGAYTLAHWLGYMVAGIGVFAAGYALDLGGPTSDRGDQ
jgi:hypothetical protein